MANAVESSGTIKMAASAVIESARGKTEALRKLADDLCVAFEAYERELAAEHSSLDAAVELVKKNAADLYEREQKVARREQEVQNIRQIAAERKTQLVTAQQLADTAHAERRKAEISLRMAVTEKSRLEEAVATLIREKRELQESLSAARLLINATDQEANPAPSGAAHA